MRRLKESQLCGQFPDKALDFLDLVTGEELPLGSELAECLKQIRPGPVMIGDFNE